MARWNRQDLEAAGIIPECNKPKNITLATCFRCGQKHPIKDMVEVGNEVFKCGVCIAKVEK